MEKVKINLIIGHYKWCDGREYLGDWRVNKKEGEGKFWSDDSRYEGEFKANKKEGFGLFEL
jgi:hypothetical protein